MENYYESVFGLTHSSIQIPELELLTFEYTRGEKSIHIFPIIHEDVHFSYKVNEVLDTINPEIILIELPVELTQELTEGVLRLPLVSVLHDGNLEFVEGKGYTMDPIHSYIIHPGEPLFWLAYKSINQGNRTLYIDTRIEGATSDWGIGINYIELSSIGWKEFWKHGSPFLQMHLDSPHFYRSIHMSERIKETDSNNILFSCGAAHFPIIHYLLIQDGYTISVEDPFTNEIIQMIALKLNNYTRYNESIKGVWSLVDVHPHDYHLIINSIPFIIGEMINEREFEILTSIRNIFFTAEQYYKEKFDDNVATSNYKRLFQYLRNLNRIKNSTIPSLYDMLLAAKGMVDDDFAFEVYRTAISYPFVPTEDNALGNSFRFLPDKTKGEIIKFAFKRKYKRYKVKKSDFNNDDPFDIDPIKEEQYPGEWKEVWDKHGKFSLVSYPPEDEFIEQYFEFLRKRIKEILMEEQASTFEFESSLEDGIDWRTTMRYFHEGKIYVKKYPRLDLIIGALVVQFLEEPYDDEDYNHHLTLFAEHDKESQISFISTQPGVDFVGPGICRVKYAAIISQFPPISYPYLIPKGTKDLKTRLIYTAMNMSLSKIIGFVSPKPPTPAQRHFASINGFRLVYLPMAQLTKVSLNRLRTLHLIAHKDLRDIAKDYIGF
ncbi:MAG: hypothetical protein OEZ01_00845 [Candidatus Heimdallarchaeota archaeon]|nr:hypothetical protein [Candidatus Heimdallarchaeota archaeon]